MFKNDFLELLKKVGSGSHTSKPLTRSEAKLATKLMLLQEATPAQIGAFMIAHRIKRPTAMELAGMLDAYDEFSPQLNQNNFSFEYPITILGNPYDGRSRTAPVTPITALLLATAGIPVIMHGGDYMPTKYGLPLVEIWQGLGVDFSSLSLENIQDLLKKIRIGFIYTKKLFPIGNSLIPYREQIGKRPPFATLELIWNPISDNKAFQYTGFVHPPTETLFREVLKLRNVNYYTTIKGLEGSCDLSLSRTAIIGIGKPDGFERLLVNPIHYGLGKSDPSLESKSKLIENLQDVIQGKNGELMNSAIFNGGFYLWRCGICDNLEKGLTTAEVMLTQGKVSETLDHLSNLTRNLAGKSI